MKNVDKGVRLTNYLVDYGIILIIWLVFMALFNEPKWRLYGFYALFFLYYLILETIFGQTIGKRITNTHVVGKNGSKALFIRVLMRSLLRIVPIDPLSYLFGTGKGIHDVLSQTQLRKIQKKPNLKVVD